MILQTQGERKSRFYPAAVPRFFFIKIAVRIDLGKMEISEMES